MNKEYLGEKVGLVKNENTRDSTAMEILFNNICHTLENAYKLNISVKEKNDKFFGVKDEEQEPDNSPVVSGAFALMHSKLRVIHDIISETVTFIEKI